jgi:hypothetical protein
MKRSTKIGICYRGVPMLFYRAALPLSSQTLTCTARVIRRHRRKTGSPWNVNSSPSGLLPRAMRSHMH